MELTKTLEGTATIEPYEFVEKGLSKQINLEYYILEVNGYSGLEENQRVYGIQIVKTEIDQNDKIKIETELIPDLSTNKEGVKNIIKKLIEHKVTPVSLYNVLEDIIGIN